MANTPYQQRTQQNYLFFLFFLAWKLEKIDLKERKLNLLETKSISLESVKYNHQWEKEEDTENAHDPNKDPI